jgi:RNA polymerase sigma factor (sigma-70 family)
MVATGNECKERGIQAGDHLSLADQIAGRLSRWYGWVAKEDLQSYAFLGLAMATRCYQSDRGVPFASFAYQKGTFLAIDEMRKDGVLRRRSAKAVPAQTPLSLDIADPHGQQAYEKIAAHDLCSALLRKLRPSDRQLLMLYYASQLTFKEIAEVFEISESAVCLRHKALIARLRKLARLRRMA